MLFSQGCQSQANLPVSAGETSEAGITILSQREYVVHQQLALINEGPGQPEKQNIWVALI